MNQKRDVGTMDKNIDRSKTALLLTPVKLPKPKVDHDQLVSEALKNRKTIRSIGSNPVSLETLSNLLWAACGVNRQKGPFGIPGRTAGSASNSQEIELYVMQEEGIYRYDASAHILDPVVKGDHRELAIGPGQRGFGEQAPLHLIYVVDLDKFSKAGYQEPGLFDDEIRKSYYYVDTGLIAQNVYLFTASQGMAAWFHNCDRDELTRILKLNSHKKVLFGQTVGYADE